MLAFKPFSNQGAERRVSAGHRSLLAALGCSLMLMLPGPLSAQERVDPVAEQHRARSLDELLDRVRSRTLQDQEQLREREAEFAEARDRQAALLAEARAERDAAEARSRELELAFDEKKKITSEKSRQLDDRLGGLKELFGIFQQTAGDLQGLFHNSPISAQHPDRGDFLEAFAKKMGRASQISTIEEIEQLWFELQREMTESGRIAQFDAQVLTPDGGRVEKTVTRLGSFNVITDDPEPRYLTWRADQQLLAELPRQPAGRLLGKVDDYLDSRDGFASVAIDPTGGGLLERLVDAPGLKDRIRQGGLVGYVIIALGAVALLVALIRLLDLAHTQRRVQRQKADIALTRSDNPLGRVLQVYDDNQAVDAETLEMKLSEAILRESPRINRALTFLKIVAVAAPLMGLLGTVTGMINTFQAITLFGTGDPKTMAGGISQALVTTVLGLTVAIPVLFLHAAAAQRARAILHLLREQSAGLVAESMEKRTA